MGEAHRLEHASLLSTTHVRFNHAVLKRENKVLKNIVQCFILYNFLTFHDGHVSRRTSVDCV